MSARFYLFESLLKAGLFGHRQGTDGVPAIAKLLHLIFDPSCVVPTGLHELTSRAFKCLDTAGPLSQFFLESLEDQQEQRMRFVIDQTYNQFKYTSIFRHLYPKRLAVQ